MFEKVPILVTINKEKFQDIEKIFKKKKIKYELGHFEDRGRTTYCIYVSYFTQFKAKKEIDKYNLSGGTKKESI